MTAADAITSFHDPAVRDLAWLLFSPDLLSASRAGAPLACPAATEKERETTLVWLTALDRDPAALHAQVHKPSLTRLGFYAEALLEHFLTHGPHARLIAANIPLRTAERTLGEVDFLLENVRGERLHWELAVKFYLHIGEGDGAATLAHYVGPNLQDRFDLKHARLLNHQLGLSAHDEFASLGFEGPWRAELFVKGRLFYRDDSLGSGLSRNLALNPPPELAVDHLRGWWKTASEWQDSKADGVFASLPRLGWMAERTLSAQEGEALAAQTAVLSERVATLTSPIMVARYERYEGGERDACATGDVWREHSRGFIVPDEWPERAADFAG
ncbi:DUF1853 family protein [Burkholderia sp. S171]|uniref:DUF1853 family protein n=1 Tax=Burkholderia sp. S171 TaxID=1641860 RepID=UPI00131DD03E|nr:DUF1853 family protein [Burkholderia sp. S171]